MNCNEIKDMLSLYMDDELNESEKLMVEKHIQSCDKCRKELEEYKDIKNLLQSLPEEEPPEGYCNRLHEKLLKEKSLKRTNRRWVKYGSIAAAFVLIFAVYAISNMGMGRGSKSENINYDMAATEAPQEDAGEPSPDYNQSDGRSAGKESTAIGYMSDEAKENSMLMTTAMPEKRKMKIIKTGTFVSQTENYDEFVNDLISKVSSLEGYIEENNTSVHNVHDNRELKYGNLKIRIPQEHFYEFVNYLEESSEVFNKNIKETDATKEYYEKDNRVKNLEIQEEHLRELFDKAQTVEETLLIENELRRVRTEIDSLNISLKDIDDRASMSTINLDIEEVLPTNFTLANKDSLWERSKEGFINTVNIIIEIGENLIISIISLAPILIPIIIVFIIVIFRIKKHRKNKL